MRKRLKRSTVLVAGLTGLALASACAFFVGNFLIEGSHQGTVGSGGTGSATLPMNISWPENELTPSHPVELTAKFENTAGRPITEHKISFTITPEVSGCKASWFEIKAVKTGETSMLPEWEGLVKGEEGTITYPVGENNVVKATNIALQLKMKEEAAVNQSVCEGSKVTVAGKVS